MEGFSSLTEQGKAEVEAYLQAAHNCASILQHSPTTADGPSSAALLTIHARSLEAVVASASLPEESGNADTSGAGLPETGPQLTMCSALQAAPPDKVETQVAATDDSYGPHAPITADMLTYGLICERFAVDPYVNGHEIIGIDNLLAALRGIPTDISLGLKGLKPYLPFTRWIRVTDANKAFFENKTYFPYFPASVLSGTDHFQLTFFFPSAFGVAQGPIYVVVIHNMSKFGPLPLQLKEEFCPRERGHDCSLTLANEGMDLLANLRSIKCQLGMLRHVVNDECPDMGDVKYLADFGVLKAIRCYADWCKSNKSYVAAVDYYRMEADQGHAAAQFNLGVIYDHGRGVPQDDTEALKWYRLAAAQGYAAAQYNLGVMYANGRGVPQDDTEALKWYRLAAEQGYADAQNNLGFMNEVGRGVGQDYIEAVKWYLLAAEQGHLHAQFNLGCVYDNGRGIPQDDTEAVKWYRMAAEQGYANAQYRLGFMYEVGKGVGQADIEAVKWYRMAAEQGYADAQNNLGVMCDNGRGIPQDDTEAVKWYRMAAEQGHADAQNNLGVMCENGKGVAQDDAEAVKWYRMAAEQGHADATQNLGNMYK
jgi:TPR repeat protein